MRFILLITLVFITAAMQAGEIRLRVLANDMAAANALAFLNYTDQEFRADADGVIVLSDLPTEAAVVTIFVEGYRSEIVPIDPEKSYELTIVLKPLSTELKAVEITEERASGTGHGYLRYIEVDGLYAAKKNEVVVPDQLSMNASTNNGRQVFMKVPGVNVQETDAGGLQLGVGARGLDPKRTTNFNTRQDGYDIAADALGYPESYYTPAIEAVEQIEMVRGAASLQYGTQFGGLLNFKMKRGNLNKALEATLRQTVGSYGFYNTFTSLGGGKGDWNYYGYFQHKEGSGWRPNSFFNANAAYAQVGRQLGDRWSVDLAITHSHYTAKQPGGLTDIMFEQDPSQSHRSRNWFRVNWNIASVTVNGKISKSLTINTKTFLVDGERAALGFLGNINRIDTMGNRDLILGEYLNLGNETRLIQRFNLKDNPGAVLLGSRIYNGQTRSRQGDASDGVGPDFMFLNPDRLEGSDYAFPSQNAALFSEALIPMNACWYITPGARFEYINTKNEGYYLSESRHPITNEVLQSEQVYGADQRARKILLMGIGTTYRCFEDIEIYGNISQNYRAINFSDIRVMNDNLMVDSTLEDESGWTLDLGFRGKVFKNRMTIDGSLFYIAYNNRIGLAQQKINDFTTKLVRTNIGDARFLGLELFQEMDLAKFFTDNPSFGLSWFSNVALVRAHYLGSAPSTFAGNRVENVPVINLRTGLSFNAGPWCLGAQFSHTGEQFTDATNAVFYPDATVGTIPAYSVLDFSAKYQWQRLQLEASINNATDQLYFTRRATGYPGPGIIPAERRMVYLTAQIRL